MATAKKATEAAESAKQQEANISTSEAKTAENGASESTEPVYSVSEYASAADKVFSRPYSPDIIVAAFASAGKKEATKAEAEEIVRNFANKEVTN